MRLPNTVQVGGYSYTIDTSEQASLELQNKSCYGDHSSFLKRIRLDNGAPQQQLDNDFLHEILHAVDHVYFDRKTDEAVLCGLANGLHQVFNQLGIHFEVKRGK